MTEKDKISMIEKTLVKIVGAGTTLVGMATMYNCVRLENLDKDMGILYMLGFGVELFLMGKGIHQLTYENDFGPIGY